MAHRSRDASEERRRCGQLLPGWVLDRPRRTGWGSLERLPLRCHRSGHLDDEHVVLVPPPRGDVVRIPVSPPLHASWRVSADGAPFDVRTTGRADLVGHEDEVSAATSRRARRRRILPDPATVPRGWQASQRGRRRG